MDFENVRCQNSRSWQHEIEEKHVRNRKKNVAMFPLAETTFPLAETTFPLGETTFPLAETAFPLAETMSPRRRLGICLLGARTNFGPRDMFARGPNHMLPRSVHFPLQLSLKFLLQKVRENAI